MKQSHVLSYFETADEDHLDLLFGFDNHALENMSYDLIVIADRVISQSFYNREDLIESGFCILTFLLCISNPVKLNLQFCIFIHESLCFFLIKGFAIISGDGFEHLLEFCLDLCDPDLKVEAVVLSCFH